MRTFLHCRHTESTKKKHLYYTQWSPMGLKFDVCWSKSKTLNSARSPSAQDKLQENRTVSLQENRTRTYLRVFFSQRLLSFGFPLITNTKIIIFEWKLHTRQIKNTGQRIKKAKRNTFSNFSVFGFCADVVKHPVLSNISPRLIECIPSSYRMYLRSG